MRQAIHMSEGWVKHDTWDTDDGIMAYADMNTRKVMEDPHGALSDYVGYMYTEKKDGWQAIWDGKDSVFTKSGKRKFAVPEYLLANFYAHFPGVAVAGEFVVEGAQASEVSKLLSPYGPWDKAVFYAFDLPGKQSRALPYHERYELLAQPIKRPWPKSWRHWDEEFKVLPAKTIHDVDAFYEDWTDIITCHGKPRNCLGEGVVITHPDSLYVPRRVGKKTRVKLKRRADDEAIVIGHNPKSLKVQKVDSKVTFTLGIGFTNAHANLRKAFPINTIVKYSRSMHASEAEGRAWWASAIRQTCNSGRK